MRYQQLVLAAAICLPALGSAQDPAKKADPAARAPGRDAVQTLIRDGMLAYRKGDLKLSVEKLRQAIQKIEQKGERGLADYLPKIDGWKAGKPEVTSGVAYPTEGTEESHRRKIGRPGSSRHVGVARSVHGDAYT